MCLSPRPLSDSWSELCHSVFRYASTVPASHRSQPLLMSRLENLLEKVRLRGCRARGGRSEASATRWIHGDHEDDDMYPAASPVPWDDVLMVCIDHRLRDWQIPGPPACQGGALVLLPEPSSFGVSNCGEHSGTVVSQKIVGFSGSPRVLQLPPTVHMCTVGGELGTLN